MKAAHKRIALVIAVGLFAVACTGVAHRSTLGDPIEQRAISFLFDDLRPSAARQSTRHDGDLLLLGDDALSPNVAERLGERLERELGAEIGPHKISLRAADVRISTARLGGGTPFAHGAGSMFGFVGLLAAHMLEANEIAHRITVRVEADFDGMPFAGSATGAYRAGYSEDSVGPVVDEALGHAIESLRDQLAAIRGEPVALAQAARP